MGVTTLVPQTAVEAIDQPIVNRFAGTDEVQPDTVLVSPCVHRPRLELPAVVHGHRFRCSSDEYRVIQTVGHLRSAHGYPRLQRQALPGILVYQRQDPETATVLKPLPEICSDVPCPDPLIQKCLRQSRGGSPPTGKSMHNLYSFCNSQALYSRTITPSSWQYHTIRAYRAFESIAVLWFPQEPTAVPAAHRYAINRFNSIGVFVLANRKVVIGKGAFDIL